eukprot:TRINITY_DN3336_c0_g4_i1.p5 TRINITY_DN3336_c0_g4~~TRINITY_DN3336_c0_g4_i1.p5  ORF type:complete len:104 (-),score=1.43 TRINITY_DN3336_c0_g4_i1:621-932(-)
MFMHISKRTLFSISNQKSLSVYEFLSVEIILLEILKTKNIQKRTVCNKLEVDVYAHFQAHTLFNIELKISQRLRVFECQINLWAIQSVYNTQYNQTQQIGSVV